MLQNPTEYRTFLDFHKLWFSRKIFIISWRGRKGWDGFSRVLVKYNRCNIICESFKKLKVVKSMIHDKCLAAWKVSKYGVNSGPYFPLFGLSIEIYGVNLRIQPKCRNIRTRNNSVFGYFSRSYFSTKAQLFQWSSSPK